MQEDKTLGTDALQEYIVPPRLKIVQKQASDDLLANFSPGDIILTPTMSSVLELPRDDKGRVIEDEPAFFEFVPLFFYAEWATVNPIQMKNEAPMIRYRTVDPNDPIVAKARNQDLRLEPIPGRTDDLKMRHVQFLNFIVTLVDHPLAGTAILMSFSRAEHSTGSAFASMIKMRKAPLFGCRFKASVRKRQNQLGEWWGLKIENPDEKPFVQDADTYEAFKQLHMEYAEYHKSAKLRADLEGGYEEDEAATTPTDDM
jgi:hypothetical protein